MVGRFTERRDDVVNAFLKTSWFLETKAITEGIIIMIEDAEMDLIFVDEEVDVSSEKLCMMEC